MHSDCDDLSDNSFNENEIIESDVESADEYDDSSDHDSSDDESTVTDSGDNMGKDIFDGSHELKMKISPTHRWIIIMLIMVSHNLKK